ncbi:MAG: hypothetical protein A3C49_00295 [Candidatus Doudnabacteria bacterium RIFCSPHIGHO2_02_FULL_42_25]|uniref:Glycosyltransferase 2-like domain-containing protein n=1 Tax=Candidatus Doudnabacteria bacterium RIFCSPHIGHO2_01_FULL_41_86 TaxID=1817821 RepID=A0A1F5N7Y4_9BACT|nr:MAG: hypothetical protein A2717_03335 [Candidatus Doudnabacteria bacterium RIFCSPHIGHO2_01_FULL_41_86]OGE75674.1 MAG: hypothetical protein A3K07_00355 [Candidatus Doudnabacteria bacterium RIFCSPHIGHO2_01_43_10]OGE85678.1 MAG: hypothetical protein A3E28_02665 [Candidatus Doudnabacteria bacterium RIFCSPHIGHO2_12_FULL_42_22]OGE87173.1 MAG: hypothetical protein A3C49_00295 [Candidatus Doudnabacteria bacterium RIFCSPHIGHO2_02_FULL_42_25]OGE92011.1 MAG: hypothetical protein A2895_00170 [Candidatus
MKVSVIILPFRRTQIIKPVFDAIFAQTHKDLEVIAVLNDSNDGSREIIQANYPQVKILEPGQNLFFAKGVNLGINNSIGEFIQLVNDDLILEPNYIEEILKAFSDPKVASATGKILRYDFANHAKTKVIDTLGLVLDRSGRVRDIAQLEIDRGQSEASREIFGVSGAGPMHRKSALDKVKYQDEYLDEDFVMYWDDADLSWRLQNAGFISKYIPTAIAYHGRSAGQSKGGYKNLLGFIKHHKKLSPQILRWNYKNHILMYIKNAKHVWHPAFILRELAMLGYIIIFETSTLKVIPELFRQLPSIWKKRKFANQ